MRTKFSEFFIGIAFILIGITVVIGGVSLTKSKNTFKETAVETTARVEDVEKYIDSDGDITYDIDFIYIVDGKTYNGTYRTSYYSSEGSAITVYYDKNNPERVETTLSSSGGVILSIMGIVFCSVGILIFIHKRKQSKNKKNLLANGEKIYADFEEVVLNTSYRVNNRSPYVIVCKATDNITGEVRTFKSVNIWDNPQIILAQKNVKTFPVYIDKNNRNKYYVSLEEIGLD